MGRVVASALVACALAGGGCASLAGLDDRPADSGTDARDAAVTHLDAGSHDVSTGHDTATGDGAAVREAAKEEDAGHDAAYDAGVDTGCVEYQPVDAGSPSCPAAEAGTCSPQPLSGFSAAFVPPIPHTPVCTDNQIKTLMNECFSSQGSTAACTALLQSASLQACNACMITASTASAWGALVYHSTSGFFVPNVGGCIATLAPCQLDCALASEAAQECAVAACETACLSDVNQFNVCSGVAGTCECHTYAEANLLCQEAMPTGPDAVCYADAQNFVQAGIDFGTLFCGGAPEDAGAD